MGTWFDKERGINSGRIIPEDIVPADGDHVFVLGQERPAEEAVVGIGDFTSVRQLVDLTDFDFVKATFDTIGQATEDIPDNLAIWPADAAEIMRFELSDIGPGVVNSIPGGLSLTDAGNILHSTEAYSGHENVCRKVDTGLLSGGNVIGVNTPEIDSDPGGELTEATIQFWINLFLEDSPIVTSAPLARIGTGIGGTGFGVRVVKNPGGFSFLGDDTLAMGNLGTLYEKTMNPGWEMVTVVYDKALPLAGGRFKLYVNQNYLGHAPTPGPATDLLLPQSGNIIAFGTFLMPSELGPWRLLKKAMTHEEIGIAYQESTTGSTFKQVKWTQQILINGVVYAQRTIQATERRRWTDFIAPVRRLNGLQEIEFRLLLEEV